MDSRPLRIIHWNARGLRGKVAPLRLLLREQDIDVALISETHLGPEDRCKFPGYLVYRKDEQSALGARIRGLAALVKRRVVHQELPLPALQTAYALGVQLHMAGEDIKIYAFYKPPRNRLDMTELRALLNATNQPTILAGDFNSKHPAWNSNITNEGGRRLFADAEAFGYSVSGPDAPTHYPDVTTHMPDVIDIIVHRGLKCQVTQQVLDDELQSDHHPVLVVLSGMPTRQMPQAPRRLIDWDVFTERIESTTPTRPVTSAGDVDALADDVTLACTKHWKQPR